MSNPWLGVPLQDYEGHMSLPQVQQLTALSELFGEALRLCRPESVAVLGIAGGNGLERVDAQLTKRVVGLDINPAYLQSVAERYSTKCNLELHCVDLAHQVLTLDPVDLVHAALVFEHAGTQTCLDNATALIASGGAVSVVLQLPSELEEGVSSTPFASIQKLKGHFEFVDPAWLRSRLEDRGLPCGYETRKVLPAGKAFWMGVFRRRTLP